jgi:MYXO-CTERM domain-containing protein
MTRRPLSFGLGVSAVLALVACSQRDSSKSPTRTTAPVIDPAGEAFHPTASVNAESLVARARTLFVNRKGDGAPFLPTADVDVMRAFPDGIDARPMSPKNQATALTVRLPRTAEAPMGVTAGAMRVDVQAKGFSPSAVEWSEYTAVYPSVAKNVDAFRVINTRGVEDLYLVTDATFALSFTYELNLTNVAGLRLVADNLELLDESGTPRLAMPTPMVFDTTGAARAGHLAINGCAFDTKGIGPWGRAVTAPGAKSCTLTVSFESNGLRYPVLVDPAWQGTATTKQSHAYHKLIRIAAGGDKDKVLLVGGTGSLPLTTELFDPTSQTWATSTNLPSTLPAGGLGVGTNAVGFSNGSVFLAGGYGVSTATTTAQATTALRDPATGVWTTKAAMDARAWHTMSLATIDAKEVAVVVGGQQTTFLSSTSPALKSTQYYEPVGDNWFSTGNMSTGRDKHRAAVLTDGRILVAGGETYTTFTQSTNTSEVFNPATKSWSNAGTMTTARTQPELVALASGKAVIAGGSTSYSSASGVVNTLEVWDGTSTWKTLTTATLSQARWQFGSAKLDDGKVLFMGGQWYDTVSFTYPQTASADLFNPGADPTTGTMTGAGSMIKERTMFSAVNVPTLGVLVTGGLSGTTETTGSEVFNTKVGGSCTGGCPSGTTCRDAVCCLTPTCGSGESCANPGREGVCTKANGAACGGNNECASGYCVGGFCCESSCTGTCSTCDATGKCIKTPAGKLCQGQPECGRTCDALGTCTFTYVPMGTACGPGLTDAGTGLFCEKYGCAGTFASCSKTVNNCGLTCTTSVTCDEPTKTCKASPTGIKAGYCVIDSNCFSYGDINPKDSCQVCDPPTSKTSWSTAVSCMDGSVDTGVEDTGVEDTGSGDDTGSTGDDTGSTGDDTGTTGDDTGTVDEDAAPDAAIGADLPEASTCGCRTPGGDVPAGGGALAALGIALAVASRRRRV